jgi:hypothetical protein
MMRMVRTIILVLVGSILLAACAWLAGTSRANTESPQYEVLRTEGKFELRSYPGLTVVTTPMDGAGTSGAFGRLFRFITGGNAGHGKIAMTTPVLIDAAEEQRTMSFIMPRKATATGVPSPEDERLKVRTLGAAKFAALRFSGGRSAENEQAAAEALRRWIGEQGLIAEGGVLFAYYDPPWTPIPMRRNEVLVRVKDAAR